MAFSNACWRIVAATGAFGLIIATTAQATTHLTGQENLPPVPKVFPKGASQFCFSELAPKVQAERFGRILSLGASFTHGCIGCDASLAQTQNNILTGDAYWLRRNFLVRFLTEAPWKDDARKPDGIFAVENDGASKPKGYVTDTQAATEGYTGVWHFSRARDDVQLLSTRELEAFQKGTRLLNEADAIGGIETRFNLDVRKSSRHGVAMTSYAFRDGQYVPLSKVFDVSVDGGRLQDLFRTQGGAPFLARLEASRWADPLARAQAIEAVSERLASYKPSIVLAIDVLFWDAFVRTLSLMRENGTSSLVLRFLIGALERSPNGPDLFDQVRAQNVRTAFYEVMRRVSRGDTAASPEAVPILIAKLLDNAPDRFKTKRYEPVIAAILGEFASQMTGKDLASELLIWLRRESENFTPPGNASQDAVPLGPQLSGAEKRRARAALEAFDRSRPRDPSGRSEQAQLPALARPLVTALLIDVLKESGSLLSALGAAMNEANAALRAITADSTNNIHLVNADAFFEDFASFLKPETMHPSVAGARRMGEMMNSAVCSSKEPQE
ncbi:MAG: hypothetical protein IOD12_14245 [Silvanigrellales bacterium]|nr:hypothetical protein [Silvanigrellales bacterium]